MDKKFAASHLQLSEQQDATQKHFTEICSKLDKKLADSGAELGRRISDARSHLEAELDEKISEVRSRKKLAKI